MNGFLELAKGVRAITEALKKAHVKEHVRHNKTGSVSTVHEHDDKRTSPLDILLHENAVHDFKHTGGGLVAFKKRGLWHYYRLNVAKNKYELTGTTNKFEKD